MHLHPQDSYILLTSILYIHKMYLSILFGFFSPGMECKLHFIHDANSPVHANQMKRTLDGWFSRFFTMSGRIEGHIQGTLACA